MPNQTCAPRRREAKAAKKAQSELWLFARSEEPIASFQLSKTNVLGRLPAEDFQTGLTRRGGKSLTPTEERVASHAYGLSEYTLDATR